MREQINEVDRGDLMKRIYFKSPKRDEEKGIPCDAEYLSTALLAPRMVITQQGPTKIPESLRTLSELGRISNVITDAAGLTFNEFDQVENQSENFKTFVDLEEADFRLLKSRFEASEIWLPSRRLSNILPKILETLEAATSPEKEKATEPKVD